MKARRVVPLLIVVSLAVAAPAQAAHKPTERARIHSLEKQVKHLRSDLAAERAATANRLDALEQAATVQKTQLGATLSLVGKLYGCLGVVPVDRAVFVPPGATDPITTLQVSIAPSPTNWLVTMKQSCLVLPSAGSPRLAVGP